MQTFAFLTLVVILLTTTHLLNWGVRKFANLSNDDGGGIFIFVICVIYGAMNFFVLKYIIIWGQALNI